MLAEAGQVIPNLERGLRQGDVGGAIFGGTLRTATGIDQGSNDATVLLGYAGGGCDGSLVGVLYTNMREFVLD